MSKKSWFEVSKEGLKNLQLRKPKHYVLRELVQNAWDEEIKVCDVKATWEKGIATLSVEDDSPVGFIHIEDAFTLFAPTRKQADPQKRGRFNLGEKQALAICEEATIQTTTGTVYFSNEGRVETKSSRPAGSKITVKLKMTKSEFDEMLEIARHYIVPEKIRFSVNGEVFHHQKPFRTTNAYLLTELEENGGIKQVNRKTDIHIFKDVFPVYLYEMGIPIIEIESEFGIDVQQKVPLSADRDSVPQKYLSAVYAEVLNVMHDCVKEEDSSQVWIRDAAANKRISPEATKAIITKRFGDKVVVANPFDPNSVDDAISAGYKVVTGSELSKEEWDNVRNAGVLKSSSELFPSKTTAAESVKPDEKMLKVEKLVKKIAKRCLNIDVKVDFAKWDGVAAQYGGRLLSFNVGALGKSFFNEPVSEQTLDLIVHELCHEKGHHTEKAYLDAITRMAGQLTMIALTEPEFFFEFRF